MGSAAPHIVVPENPLQAESLDNTAAPIIRQQDDAHSAWSSSRCADFFWMRSAGFPFEILDALEVLQDSPTLRRYEELQDRIHAAEQVLLGIVKEGLSATTSVGAVLKKLQRKFEEALPVQSSEMPAEVRDHCHPWFVRRLANLEEGQKLLPEMHSSFVRQQSDNRQRLVAALSSAEAREALFLSNPESLQRVDGLIATYQQPQVQMDSRSRQRLRLAWNYLQRLCAKNDTSSFFGPITWGRIVPEQSEALLLRRPPGSWLAQRETFFEHWVILRISQGIWADPQLAPALPLQLSFGCHLQGDTLLFPLDKQKTLQGLALTLLQEIHRAPAPGISQQQFLDMYSTPHDSDEFRNILEFFRSKGVIQFALQVAPGQTCGTPVLQQLRQQLQILQAPPGALAPWLQLLDNLESGRQRFARGGLDTRRQALEDISRHLSEQGIDLSRATGKMYVGRFPLYEDCRRNLQVSLSSTLAADLQRSMEPVMRLHHWLSGAVAACLHDHYQHCWQQLRQGSERVDFLLLYQKLQQTQAVDLVVQNLRRCLQQAWQRTLERCTGTADTTWQGEEICLSPADLQQLLKELHEQEPRAIEFPGFALGIHSPDFMLAARDENAVAQGDYHWIIGEVHPAVHTLSQPVAQPFCSDAEHIRREVNQLLAPGTAVLADSPESYQRSHIDWLEVENLYQVVLPGSIGKVPQERCIPAARGEVILCQESSKQGILHFRDREGDFRQDLLTVIPSDLHRACFALAADLLGYGTSARVVSGKLILKRRSWNIQPEELPPPSQPAEDLRGFLAWRHWARKKGMPRHVFVKLSGEPKPIYVDFANPLSLDLLANLCKSHQAMRFSEMRPSPDELWLRDQRGRYCSEFRTSFVAHRTPN